MPTVNAQYISIYVTTNCNMRCGYCYTQQCRKEEDIDSLAFFRKGIDDFFSTYPYRKIRFQGGGEPTLMVDVMQNIICYIRSRYGKVEVELQTSGFFSKEVAHWVKENVDIVWISYDGLPDVHDIHRPDMNGQPTSPVIEDNIRFLLRTETTVGIRASISTLNVNRQVEMVKYMHTLGVKSIYGDNIFVTPFNQGIKERGYGVPELMTYAKNFLIAKKSAQELGIFYGSWLTVNFSKTTTYSCTACLPYPRLTSDGYVSSCDVTFLGKEGPDIFIYGKWDPTSGKIEYDSVRMQTLSRRSLENLEKCRVCKIGPYCAGGCVGKAYLVTKSLFKIDPAVCKVTRYLAAHLPLGKGREPYEYEHP